MLELKRDERNRCTLAFDNLRTSKVRKALAFYLRDLGIPLPTAKYVVRKALYSDGSGVRLYRLTFTHYIYVDYDYGPVFVGTEDQIIDKVAERYPWQQGLLWKEMADKSARLKRMSHSEIDDFIYEMETDIAGIELLTKNVAPIERCRKRRRGRCRRKVKKVLSRIYWYDDL